MKKITKSAIIIFDDPLSAYIEDKEIENQIREIGLNKFLSQYCISLNQVQKIQVNAIWNGFLAKRLNSSSLIICFGEDSTYSSKKKNEVLEKILKDANVIDKFFTINSKGNVFFVQKIFAFDAIPKDFENFNLPKPKSTKTKLIFN